MAECLLSLCVPSQPPASPSTQEAIQGMLSMANLQASDSCLQTTWGTGQAKGGSLAAHGARKNGGGSKGTGKRLLKRTAKNSVDLEDYEEQDHLDACFKDSDYGEHGCSSRLLPGGGSTGWEQAQEAHELVSTVKPISGWRVVMHTFSPSTLEAQARQISVLCSGPAWST